MRHLELMLENTPNPKITYNGEVTQPHFFTDQVCGFMNALARVDEGEAVAEAPMEEDRDGDKRLAAELSGQIVRHGELCDIELALSDHAPVADFRGHICQGGKLADISR